MWQGEKLGTLKFNPLTPLAPKGPKCAFWQHSDFGQLTTNGVFIYFL